MPKLEKLYTLEVTIEQFLNACSPLELQEIEMLLQSKRYQYKMVGKSPADDLPAGSQRFLRERGS